MRKPYQIPTGWEQLATFSVTTTATGAAITVPTQGKWRKYVLGVAGGAGCISNGLPVRISQQTGTAATVPTAMRVNPNHPTYFGPFTIDTQLYATFPTGGGGTTLNVTLYVSIEGEIDELIRYLKGNGGLFFDSDSWVGKWDPADFVECASVEFGVTSTRNYHPILQLGTNDDDPVGGCVNGVLPAEMPYYWGSCTVRVYFTGSTVGAAATVSLRVAFERMNENGIDIDGDDFDTLVEMNPTVPAVSGVIDYVDFVLTQTQADDLIPGEMFRILLSRNAGDSGDTYADVVEILEMAMWINK